MIAVIETSDEESENESASLIVSPLLETVCPLSKTIYKLYIIKKTVLPVLSGCASFEYLANHGEICTKRNQF